MSTCKQLCEVCWLSTFTPLTLAFTHLGASLLVVNIHTPNISIHTPGWSLLVVNIHTPNISIHTPGWRVWLWQAARLTRSWHARRKYAAGSIESRNWSRAAPKTACRCSAPRTWMHTRNLLFNFVKLNQIWIVITLFRLITNQFWFDLTRFRIDFLVCKSFVGTPKNAEPIVLNGGNSGGLWYPNWI